MRFLLIPKSQFSMTYMDPELSVMHAVHPHFGADYQTTSGMQNWLTFFFKSTFKPLLLLLLLQYFLISFATACHIRSKFVNIFFNIFTLSQIYLIVRGKIYQEVAMKYSPLMLDQWVVNKFVIIFVNIMTTLSNLLPP